MQQTTTKSKVLKELKAILSVESHHSLRGVINDTEVALKRIEERYHHMAGKVKEIELLSHEINHPTLE